MWRPDPQAHVRASRKRDDAFRPGSVAADGGADDCPVGSTPFCAAMRLTACRLNKPSLRQLDAEVFVQDAPPLWLPHQDERHRAPKLRIALRRRGCDNGRRHHERMRITQ